MRGGHHRLRSYHNSLKCWDSYPHPCDTIQPQVNFFLLDRTGIFFSRKIQRYCSPGFDGHQSLSFSPKEKKMHNNEYGWSWHLFCLSSQYFDSLRIAATNLGSRHRIWCNLFYRKPSNWILTGKNIMIFPWKFDLDFQLDLFAFTSFFFHSFLKGKIEWKLSPS